MTQRTKNIFEPIVVKELLKSTCLILMNNYFYENENLHRFLDAFHSQMKSEIVEFESYAEPEVIEELENSRLVRAYFTCYFVSRNIRDVLIHKMYFDDKELKAFEKILVK